MQKIIIFFILLTVAVIGSIEAAQARGKFHDDAHPGKCVIDSLVLSPGESGKHPKQCARVDCANAEGFAQISTCGVAVPPPNCKWGAFIDENADYSKCCERKVEC